MDGLLLRCVCRDIRERLTGAVVARVDQPSSLELHLELYRPDNKSRLVVCAAPNMQGVYLASSRRSGEPTNFCMLLRKYLEGSRLSGARQMGFSRRLLLDFATPSHVCHLTPAASLRVDMFGSRGGLVLLDAEGSVLGSTGANLEPVAKLSPQDVTASLLLSWASEMPEVPWSKLLVQKVEGLSSLLARELVLMAGMRPEAPCGTTLTEAETLARCMVSIVEAVDSGKGTPVVYQAQGEVVAYHCVALSQFSGLEARSFPSCLDAASYYWEAKRRRLALEERRRRLGSVISKAIQRLERKAALQMEEASRGADAERLRVMGELLISYAHLVPAHSKTVELPNYYDPSGERVSIQLDPSLSATANAQLYFKRYRKALASQEQASEQLAKTREELAYLEQVKQALAMAGHSEEELLPIEEELRAQGYLAHPKGAPGKGHKVAGPRKFVTSEGLEVLVGRNNIQNDMITFKMANEEDVWLHAKDCPGAHVVLRKAPGWKEWPPAASLEEAARIAAFFSKARNSGRAAVDWTFVRHVRKARGARPGMVLYDHHHTIIVEPGCPDG
ncbi:MAG: Rqc2 family fibronectin-binding protein [Bacillota bacterium]